MAADRVRSLLLFVALVCWFPTSGQSILDRRVEVHTGELRLADALELIAHDGHFKLSYDASALPVDSMVRTDISGTVHKALRTLVGNAVVMKESGDHIILLSRRGSKRTVVLQGRVVDAVTSQGLGNATVYVINEGAAVNSGTDGSFGLETKVQRDRVAIFVGRAAYHDTIVHVRSAGGPIVVALRARVRFERVDPICLYERCEVEDIAVARLLVPQDRMDQANNSGLAERRRIQASLWPSISTNGPVNGAMVNEYSFNFLGGYARGLEGVELGVGVNIERNYVKGVQVAGMANLVGGDTKGLQIAGFHNHTMHSLQGLQIAGFANTVWDTLSGVQIAGGANVVRGGMRGTQVAGAFNLATQDVNGVQLAGGLNITLRDVQKTQAAGALNYGRNVNGAQVAGGVNVALGKVGGGQVAGALNVARDVTGGQVSLGVNVAVDTVRGGQVGVFNFARVVRGGQIGILNFSDTITGSSVGIFSFAWRGYHRVELVSNDVMQATVKLRTGTRAFHNILGFSPAIAAQERWGFLYGFGSEPRLGRNTFLSFDLTAEQIVEQPQWVDAVNILGRFSASFGVLMRQRFTLTGGPVLNLFVSDWADPMRSPLSSTPPETSAFEEQEGATFITGWYGWRAALGVRF